MINYLILAHKNLSQLNRMIARLDNPAATFYIHIDKRVADKDIRAFGLHLNERVRLISKRVVVNWGGFSMIEATLRLMQAASKNRKGYCVLLSGQDFPLCPNDHIHSFFERSYGKEYLESSPLPRAEWKHGGMNRLNYHWLGDIVDVPTSDLFAAFQMHNGIIRSYFEDFPPHGGSQWWCLTSECVGYILQFIRYNPIITDYFKTCLCPDEIFFQTIILNSPFKDQVINDNLRYIVWPKNASHPKTMSIDDLEPLIHSGKLWGRKFDTESDCAILDKIEDHLMAASPVNQER